MKCIFGGAMPEHKITELIFSLARSALNNEAALQNSYSEADWKKIYKVAEWSLLVPFLYDTVIKSAAEYNIPGDVLNNWKKETMAYMIYENNKYRLLHKILNLAGEQNITLIIFKGCVIADLYPNYLSRISSDTDFLVYPRDKEKAVELFQGLGYHKDEQYSSDFVYSYLFEPVNHRVELHFSLWEDFEGSRIELIKGMKLENEERLVHISACGLKVTTLGYHEHFIFLIFHIIKHFSLQGINIRYLIDITLFLNRYEEKIFFKDFWSKMEVLNYDKFCENFFHICIQRLGMSSKIMQGRSMRKTEEMERFMEDILHVGFILDKSKAGWQLMGTFAPYFLGELDIPQTKLRRNLRLLFPTGKCLPKDYSYARKHSILLPVAWLHRYLNFIWKRKKHRKEWYDAKEMFTIAEHRLSLMRSLGLAGGEKE